MQRHGLAQCLLNVHVVILDIRRADFWVDGPGVGGGCEAGEDGNAVHDRPGHISRRVNCRRAYAVVCRARIESIEWEVADKEVLREGVIVKAPSGAHHGIAVAAQVVSGAQAWSKIVEIAGIKA